MILSIIIPTYNRSSHLQPLAEDILDCIKKTKTEVELIIIDNASTDNTKEICEKLKKQNSSRFHCETRKINIGMEGNIANGILASNGKYTWILSDHQTIEKENLVHFLNHLSQLEFDYCHAKITQWGSILENSTPKSWNKLKEEEKGALLFTLGNISAFIFRSSIAKASAAELFKCCQFGYPHLGILSQLNENSTFLETENLTRLPHSTGKITHSYNIIRTRYRNNYECIRYVLKDKTTKFKKKYFFTQDYKQAFRADILNLLLTPKDQRFTTAKSIAELLPSNNGFNKLIAISCIFAIAAIPSQIRIAAAHKLKNKLKKIIIKPTTNQ